jgi:hypothetical protein
MTAPRGKRPPKRLYVVWPTGGPVILVRHPDVYTTRALAQDQALEDEIVLVYVPMATVRRRR